MLCLIKTNLINFCYVLHSSAAAVCSLAETVERGVLRNRFSGKSRLFALMST